MSETPTCVYCGSLVDPTKPYWVVERWEDGQCVARGFVNHAGCLIATAHARVDVGCRLGRGLGDGPREEGVRSRDSNGTSDRRDRGRARRQLGLGRQATRTGP